MTNEWKHEERTVAELLETLRTFSTLILTRQEVDARISMRPMSVTLVDSDGSIWFPAPLGSWPGRDADETAQAYVSAQSPHHYIVAEGRGSYHNDRHTRRLLFRDSMRTWFPSGVDDPQLGFIQLQLLSGRAWNLHDIDKVVYLVDNVRPQEGGEGSVGRAGEIAGDHVHGNSRRVRNPK